jgi:membrane dipeptidase
MPTFSDELSTDAWASALGVPRASVELLKSSEVIDLHVDSFIWTRLFGYDLRRRHGLGLLGGRFYSQVDLPRALEGHLTGATWVLTTNPFVPSSLRRRFFFENLERLEADLRADPRVQVVTNAGEFRAARARGKHAAFVGIQGGNALDHDLDDVARIGRVLRCTLVHLTPASLGQTSAPFPTRLFGDGLTDRGREMVQRLAAANVFLDLAHASRKTFFDAVAAHDRTKPFWVTHTGVEGVRPHWRNLTDEQLRLVADRGGIVGIMFQASFLVAKGAATCESVVDHLEHVIRVTNEDVPAIGSDWDGAITPPRDLVTPFDLPRLVDAMLRRGWSDTRVRKILGENALASMARLRG